MAVGLVVTVVSSLGAPLIPRIAQDFGASIGTAQWSLTVTLLTGAVLAPLVGRIGDGPRRREVLVACLAIVTLGGVIAALAGSIAVLIAGRTLQGLGLAMLPLTVASARDHLRPKRAAATIALLSIVGASGVGIGYPLTALIVDAGGVAAAFWVGTGLSAAALALTVLFVPRPLRPAQHSSLDVSGATLVGGGVLGLLLVLERGGAWGWASGQTLGMLAASAILLAWWTLHELRTVEPLVELRLLRRRAVMTANAVGFVLGAAVYLAISLMTQVVQLPSGLNQSILVAGLTLGPLSAGSFLTPRLAPLIGRRTGARGLIPLGALGVAAGMALFGLAGGTLWEAFVSMGLMGIGLGLTLGAMPGLIVGAVPQDETSSAMSFYQVTRYVGFALGSGLAVTLVNAFAGAGKTPGGDAYEAAFVVGAGMAVAAALIAWVLPERRGAPALRA